MINQLKQSRKHKKILMIVSGFLFFMWFIPLTPLLRFVDVIEVERANGDNSLSVEVDRRQKNWVGYSAVPQDVRNAFVVAEDGNFFNHFGFDFYQIRKSIELNWKKGRYVRGGSTISQQLVKISFLSHDKSLIRKAREALGTILLELTLSKQDILEWYFNLVELGPGIYGMREAANYYFQKSPGQLSLLEGVYLAMILPNPRKRSTWIIGHHLNETATERVAFILRHMRLMGYINQEKWRGALLAGNFGTPLPGAYEEISEFTAKYCESFPEKCEDEVDSSKDQERKNHMDSFTENLDDEKNAKEALEAPEVDDFAKTNARRMDEMPELPPDNIIDDELEPDSPENESVDVEAGSIESPK